MEKKYTAELNGVTIYMLREEGNAIGKLYQSMDDLEENAKPFAIAVGDEAMCMGASVGWLSDVTEIE